MINKKADKKINKKVTNKIGKNTHFRWLDLKQKNINDQVKANKNLNIIADQIRGFDMNKINS